MTDMQHGPDLWATFPTLQGCWFGNLAMTIEIGLIFECNERTMT